ncbi:unnamed protein product [Heligmosomoides polygyrus]|uniref:MADS-box domain-containing protein n=1 Tax=Heligmosomoides polygyrus TaxID=6339 RepID=A0A183FMK5_HELPZ|nr:unnamed protein product [Heligmosomoides polygyrus]
MQNPRKLYGLLEHSKAHPPPPPPPHPHAGGGQQGLGVVPKPQADVSAIRTATSAASKTYRVISGKQGLIVLMDAAQLEVEQEDEGEMALQTGENRRAISAAKKSCRSLQLCSVSTRKLAILYAEFSEGRASLSWFTATIQVLV